MVYIEVRKLIELSSYSVCRNTVAYVVVRTVRRRFLIMHKILDGKYDNEQSIRRGFECN